MVSSSLLENTPIPESATAELLSAICRPGSAESEELLTSGVAARLCDAIVEAAARRIGGEPSSTSSTSSTSSSSLLTSLRILRNLCASGSKAGDALAPTGVARAAAVLSAAAAAAAAASSASPSSSASPASCSFLAVAARQGGPRVAGPAASAADAALLQRLQRAMKGAKGSDGPPSSGAAAASGGDGGGGGGGDDAAELLCSSSLLAAVVDGLHLESGTLHDDDGDAEGHDEGESAKSAERERDAAATAVAARAVARLLRSLSFRLPLRGGGLSLALEALRKGPPVKRERVETALRLLGHVVAEEGCCAPRFAPSPTSVSASSSSSSSPAPSSSSFYSFAAAILGALDSPAASPGEVEACLALLREVAARDDDEKEKESDSPPPPSPSPSSPSSTSVVAALVRAGLVPMLLERISDLPPVRGQEEAEAESDARRDGKAEEEEEEEGEREREGEGEGGKDEQRRKQTRDERQRSSGSSGSRSRRRRRRLPRYPEERADTVAVLANALHRRRYVAESLLRCEGGAELLLAQCGAVGAEEAGEGEWRRRQQQQRGQEQGETAAAAAATRGNGGADDDVDENNTKTFPPPPSRSPLPPTVGAFAREWALWGLRNLTEASEEARGLLSDLRPVRAIPSEELERAGLRLELDEGSGKFELRKIG